MASSSQRSTSSLVWKYFDIDENDESKVVCKECKKLLSRGGKDGKSFNTTNLKKHLQSKHKEKNEELSREEAQVREEEERLRNKRKLEGYFNKSAKQSTGATTSRSTNEVQLTLDETYVRKQTWDINSPQSQIIHKAIGEMIAADCQPYSIVEDTGFGRLMKKLKPNYELPGRKYFSTKIIPDIQTKVLAKVKNVLKEAENISFTTDIWTSSSDTAFISLTAHCTDINFERKTVVLRVAPFPGSHTASNIADMIESVIQEFKIPSYKIHIFVRDNGANIVRGIQDTGYGSLSCFLHTLQLVVHDSIFEQRLVKDIIANCKQIVGHFSHSALAYNKLAALQKQHDLPEHKLIQDVPTRWNSTYFMIERIVEQKAAVANYCLDTPNLPVFDANKWTLLGKLTALLKIFHKITVRLSERSATVSEIIPQIKFLQVFVTKASTDNKFSGLGSTLFAINSSMKRRFERYLDDYNPIIATYLDPRYKTTFFQNEPSEDSKMHESNLERTMSDAITKRTEAAQEENGHGPHGHPTYTSRPTTRDGNAQETASATDNSVSDELIDFDFDKCMDQLVQKELSTSSTSDSSSKDKNPCTSVSSLIKDEMIKYNMLELHSRDGDPFIWWKKNEAMFPMLSCLANKYLSSPPSSIESERLFSTGGNIYTPHRNRLSSDRGEMLMFLHYNLQIFDFDY